MFWDLFLDSAASTLSYPPTLLYLDQTLNISFIDSSFPTLCSSVRILDKSILEAYNFLLVLRVLRWTVWAGRIVQFDVDEMCG